MLIAIILLAIAIFIGFKKRSSTTSENTLTPTQTPPTPTISQLDQTQNKVLLGQNDNYAAYLINPTTTDNNVRSGEIYILNRKDNSVIKITGTVNITGSTIVSDSGDGRYLSLSNGTANSSRTDIIIFLIDKTPVNKEFCMIGQPILWNDYVIYNNCDYFTNRPWDGGTAPSIIATNLKTGTSRTLLKSDLSKHFGIKSVLNKTLSYYQTYLTSGSNWTKTNLQKTITKTFDLSILK